MKTIKISSVPVTFVSQIRCTRMKSAPTKGERVYATEVLPTQRVTFYKRNPVDDTTDVWSYLYFNIFTCLCCCCPIGLIGIIFSMLCEFAKASGKKGRAKCFSTIAEIFFVLSVTGGFLLIPFLIYYYYMNFIWSFQ